MRIMPTSRKALLLLAVMTAPVSGVAYAQAVPGEADPTIVVSAVPPADLSGLPAGPEVEGIISARSDSTLHITMANGERQAVMVSDATRIRANGGFLGLSRNRMASNALVNGLPVRVRTVEWAGNLVARQVDLKRGDLRTAAMIHGGTDQRFTEQAAATEALRGRVGDIDQYNVKQSLDVTFASGQAVLSGQAQAQLCGLATQAGAVDNSLLLVLGYTDSTGDEDYNQALSERRAGRVVNYLQQACGWKPYRMLTPAGMSESNPAASNDSEAGMAQNRRVTVSVLVSKAVDGM